MGSKILASSCDDLSATAMKILVEQSGYSLRNMGDLAMLQVTVERLQTLWADAEIHVFTSAPQRLERYCPNTHPVQSLGRQLWFQPLFPRVPKVLPYPLLAKVYEDWEWWLRLRSPQWSEDIIRARIQNPSEQAAFETFTSLIHEADLVIASGGGYMTDVFKPHAINILNTLGLAIQLGKPTALLGQGMGPLNGRHLSGRTQSVLPQINLITLREKRSGLPILERLGVSREQVLTTGDDAIEMAYRARPAQLGDGIGINLRVAEYSGFDAALFHTLRDTLQATAQTLNVPLIPAPISRNARGAELSDSMAIQKLMQGYDDTSDGGWGLETPLQVIRQIGHCRVVVTGSYHAGVFALSQGIPVIGLVQAPYYADKFLGLADQFGVGCDVVFLDDRQLSEKLSAAIQQAWNQAEQHHSQLLEAAARQVELGHVAYQQVYQLLHSESP
jgi:polysaccharide pyruvyl transferase WcaK-like protein